MINKQTVRIGTISTEKDAARIFDFLAILTEGLSVSFYKLILILLLLGKNKLRLHRRGDQFDPKAVLPNKEQEREPRRIIQQQLHPFLQLRRDEHHFSEQDWPQTFSKL